MKDRPARPSWVNLTLSRPTEYLKDCCEGVLFSFAQFYRNPPGRIKIGAESPRLETMLQYE